MFTIGQGYKLGKHTIHEAEHMPATLAARDILAQSSNIGTLQIALRSGPTRQRAVSGQPRSAQAVEEPSCRKPPARSIPDTNWGEIETATIGFGQGISVAPLGFVTAAARWSMAAAASRRPFVKQESRDLRGEQVIKAKPRSQLRDLLRYVVTNGSGKKADIAGYDVGGKTGSAQVPGPHGGYIPHALRTAFAASSRCIIRAISCSSCSTSRMAPRKPPASRWPAGPLRQRLAG